MRKLPSLVTRQELAPELAIVSSRLNLGDHLSSQTRRKDAAALGGDVFLGVAEVAGQQICRLRTASILFRFIDVDCAIEFLVVRQAQSQQTI